ncbi:hypothetical protein MHK_003664 [Candidatus Magnetomorum sp. HK-1]|nr:hypothetical protein MHK_003664 [Candidatus Magnetomorum sp. HK-1]
MITEIPYVILKNDLNQYYWSFKVDDNSFPLIPIANENIPMITNAQHMDTCDVLYRISKDKYAYAMGYIEGQQGFYNYLWQLSVTNNRINRVRYNNGVCDPFTEIEVNNKIGKNVYSEWIKPAANLNKIYFIDPVESLLVKFHTRPLTVEGFELSFDIKDEYTAIKTSIAANSDTAFVFGNGKVYVLESNQLLEKADIAYSFNDEFVNYSDNWNNLVQVAESIYANDKIYLLLKVNDSSYPKPNYTNIELLEFDPETHSFHKNIVELTNDFKIENYTYLHNTNKLLFSQYNYAVNKCQYSSYLYLFDLTTGSYDYVGATDIKKPILISNQPLSYLYAISTDTNDSYKLTKFNLDKNVKQIQHIQFIKKDDESLYIAWECDNEFDGSWNFEQNKTNNELQMKNMIMKVQPQLTQSYCMTEPFESLNMLNINSNILSSPRHGNIYKVSSDSNMKITDKVYDEDDYSCYLTFKSYDDFYVACICMDQSKKLFTKELAELVVHDNLRESTFASFKNEAIIVGLNNYHEYEISLINYLSNYKNSINFGIAYDIVHKKDINKNRFIAIVWDTFCAYADYSQVYLDIDLNKNREIDISDAILALQFCAGKKSINSDFANQINLGSAISILNYLSGNYNYNVGKSQNE